MDVGFAIAHHLLAFSLAAVLSAELASVRPEMDGAQLRRVVGLDRVYGALAALILVVGLCRVFFGDKGAQFYFANPMFWAKMGAFAVVGLLSIWPTLQVVKWRRALAVNAAFKPDHAEVRTARKYMHAEALVFLLIPVFAALMARGVGL